MNEKPAVLGGKPLFDSLVSIVRPDLPPPEGLTPLFAEAIASGMVTNHKHVREFEAAVAERLGVRHAVCVSSCTSGMVILLRGLGLCGEVILPSFTFMATACAVVNAGCVPVFVEVNEDSMTVDPIAVEKAIGPDTCAILAVHNFGRPAPVEALEEIARKSDLKLFFDSAHGMGSLRDGRPIGGFGEAEVFSLSPTKLVTSAEGGIVTTNSDETAEAVRVGRNYGNPGNYDCVFPGLSARMSELQAILGLASFGRLDEGVARRNKLADLYRDRLGELPGVSFQSIDSGDRSSCKDFTILVAEDEFGASRDVLANALKAEGVDTRRYYDPPCHSMTAFRQYVKPGHVFPNTDRLSSRCLSLPIWSGMNRDMVSRIVAAICNIHGRMTEIIAAQPPNMDWDK